MAMLQVAVQSQSESAAAAAAENARKQTSVIEAVKSAAEILPLVEDYVRLRKAGGTYKGLCPFHQERTPSFTVRRSDAASVVRSHFSRSGPTTRRAAAGPRSSRPTGACGIDEGALPWLGV